MEQTGLADCPNIVKTSTYQEAARLCCEKEGLSILPESLFHIIEADLLHIPLPEPFFVKGLLVWREEQALNPLYPAYGNCWKNDTRNCSRLLLLAKQQIIRLTALPVNNRMTCQPVI